MKIKLLITTVLVAQIATIGLLAQLIADGHEQYLTGVNVATIAINLISAADNWRRLNQFPPR